MKPTEIPGVDRTTSWKLFRKHHIQCFRLEYCIICTFSQGWLGWRRKIHHTGDHLFVNIFWDNLFYRRTGSIWLRWWESVGLVLWWEKVGELCCSFHVVQVSLQLIWQSISFCIYSTFVPRESVQLISLLPFSWYCILLVSLVQSSLQRLHPSTTG